MTKVALILLCLFLLISLITEAQQVQLKDGNWDYSGASEIPDSLKTPHTLDSLKNQANTYQSVYEDSLSNIQNYLDQEKLLQNAEDSIKIIQKLQIRYDSLQSINERINSLTDLDQSKLADYALDSTRNWHISDSLRNIYQHSLDSINQVRNSLESRIDSLQKIKQQYDDETEIRSSIEEKTSENIEAFKDKLIDEESDSTINKYSSLARQVNDSLSGFDQYQSPEEMLENYDPSKQYFSDTLPTLNEQIISKEALKLMDSLNAAENTKRIRKKVDEVGDGVERVRYYTKSGWQKTFLEATIGLVNFDWNQFSIAPVVGYELGPNFSGGLGFTYSHSIADSLASSSNLSLNALIRWDLWNRTAYLQIMNEYDLPHVSYYNKEFYKDNELSRYRAVFGVGYRYKLTKNIAFVIQIDYNLNKFFNKNDLRNDFIFKFGINRN